MAREKWLANVPASPAALGALRDAVPSLPAEYLALLSRGDGGEVGLTASPLNLCIDTAEAALAYWYSGTYTMLGVFVFGGDGGGTSLAFDMRGQEPWPVISFDPIDPKGSTEWVADSFLDLLDLVEVE
jgi:hypothetical protein